MNTLKPLLICAVLAGIGYGVYVRINRGNGAPPPGAPQEWNAPPEVQLGNATMPGAEQTWPADAGGVPGAAPPFPATDGLPSSGATAAEAPPFNPSSVPPRRADGGGSPPPDASATAPSANPAGVAEAPPSDPRDVPPAADLDSPVPPVGANNPATEGRYQIPEPSAPYPDQAPDGGLSPEQSGPEGTFAEVFDRARHELEVGQLAGALEKLSKWYGDPRLAPVEEQQLNQLLDQVAGTVVYSTQNLLEPPCEVQPGERLEDIATRYQVPWQLLAKINGIDDPGNLRPGERLKVVRGPFDAVVDLQKRELTLMLAGKMYAGRFPIGIGVDQPPREGAYTVSDKIENPAYHGKDRVISGGEAGNPYGSRWIGLGSELGIHGTDRDENIGRADLPGSISLTSEHIADVFDILATGSTVTIRR